LVLLAVAAVIMVLVIGLVLVPPLLSLRLSVALIASAVPVSFPSAAAVIVQQKRTIRQLKQDLRLFKHKSVCTVFLYVVPHM
jgi:hypothetical protein